VWKFVGIWDGGFGSGAMYKYLCCAILDTDILVVDELVGVDGVVVDRAFVFPLFLSFF